MHLIPRAIVPEAKKGLNIIKEASNCVGAGGLRVNTEGPIITNNTTMTRSTLGPEGRYLGLHRGVWTSRLPAQQGLAVHFRLQTSNVPTTEIFTQLINLLQFKKMNAQDLDRLHHLEAEKIKTCS